MKNPGVVKDQVERKNLGRGVRKRFFQKHNCIFTPSAPPFERGNSFHTPLMII